MITRVWVGKELEGFEKGVSTLFVEGLDIDGDDILPFLNLPRCKNVKRIYLGAGGKGLTRLTNIDILKNLHDIKVVIELYNNQIDALPLEVLASFEIIYTLNTVNSRYINYLKLNDSKQVKVINPIDVQLTDLTTLQNGMFINEDVLIYSKEYN